MSFLKDFHSELRLRAAQKEPYQSMLRACLFATIACFTLAGILEWSWHYSTNANEDGNLFLSMSIMAAPAVIVAAFTYLKLYILKPDLKVNGYLFVTMALVTALEGAFGIICALGVLAAIFFGFGRFDGIN